MHQYLIISLGCRLFVLCLIKLADRKVSRVWYLCQVWLSLVNHSLVLPPCQFAQLCCSVDNSKCIVTQEPYLTTRFPNRDPYLIIPGEMISTDTASKSRKK